MAFEEGLGITCTINNIIHISFSFCLNVVQNIVNFALNINHGINEINYRKLKNILARINDNGKYEVMIDVKQPLIKK